jgi:hypothetical protein
MRVGALLDGQGLCGQGVDREVVKSTHPEDEVEIQGSLLLLLMIQRRKRKIPGGQRRGDLDLV